MSKKIKLLSILTLILVLVTSCAGGNGNSSSGDKSEETEANSSTEAPKETSNSPINIISREDGSGTRGAFVEIVGVMEDDNDMTYEEATIQNSTDGVMTTVKGDENAIGYISLGSLNDTVKALKIDGVEATAEKVKSGDYKISRPFILGYKELNEIGEDFLKYILSSEGQEEVSSDGYVPMDTTESYTSPGNLSGNLVVSGSTSVTPLMEKFKEKYEELNPNVSIDIQSNGSSTGIQSTIDGAADIAMSSRNLKPEEIEVLENSVIAMDGIAIIVNTEQALDDIALDQLKEVYLGNITEWNKISE